MKVATEMLREIKVLYKNLWTGRGNNYGGGKKPDIRDVISKNIGISLQGQYTNSYSLRRINLTC